MEMASKAKSSDRTGHELTERIQYDAGMNTDGASKPRRPD
jgi:hypothetical protein